MHASRPHPQVPKPLALDSPVAELPGIGPKRAQALAERGLATIEDVLFHLPSRYQDWRERRRIAELEPGLVAVVEGTLGNIRERPMPGPRWRRLVTATLTDAANAKLRLVWFNLPAYMRGRMLEGQTVAAYGRVSAASDDQIEMVHPELRQQLDTELDKDLDGDTHPIRPVYRLGDAIPQRLYAGVVSRALHDTASSVKGAIPQSRRSPCNFPHSARRWNIYTVRRPTPT